MAFNFRKFSKFFFVTINLVLIIFFLLSGFIPYINTPKWWMGFLGLAFPYMLIFVFIFFFFWLITKPKYSLISLLSVLLCWKQTLVLFRLNNTQFNYTKDDSSIRLMTWNIKIFEGIEKGAKASSEAKKEIISFIKAVNPDILCLQEFNQYDSNTYEKNHIKQILDAGYSYYIFSEDYKKPSVNYRSGIVIFAKNPLIRQTKIPFKYSPESIIMADMVKGGDTFRIFTTHLQSFKFNKNDYHNIEEIKDNGEIEKDASMSLLSKMKKAFELRGQQTQQIRSLLDSCPYPEIICGDFNDVPTSYTYWHIRGDRQDAFMKKGKGIGRTFISLAPTLRIDYILCDNRFNVKQFVVADKRYSDHLPLITDVQLDKKP